MAFLSSIPTLTSLSNRFWPEGLRQINPIMPSICLWCKCFITESEKKLEQRREVVSRRRFYTLDRDLQEVVDALLVLLSLLGDRDIKAYDPHFWGILWFYVLEVSLRSFRATSISRDKDFQPRTTARAWIGNGQIQWAKGPFFSQALMSPPATATAKVQEIPWCQNQNTGFQNFNNIKQSIGRSFGARKNCLAAGKYKRDERLHSSSNFS